MRTFWERGYTDATLDVLGQATGLGRGSIYGAFGGKDALFRLALNRYSDIYGRRYDEAVARQLGDPVRAVEAFFDVALTRIADPTVPNGCLIAQSAVQSPLLSAASRTLVRALLEAQRARIRRALGADVAPSPELDELTEFLVAVNQSLAVMSQAGSSATELHGIVRVACGAVRAALGGPPGE
jgi:AcrR family transcriptional regulator